VTVEKVGADEAVVVGDTPYDVEAAARLGLRCIGVLTGGFSRAELEDAGAAVVVESLAELVDADWSEHFRAPTEKEPA
jgi:phosphoglycolate phosphatase-like HAD superfamily hydrolase